jgi:hypothetical protein
MQSNTEGMMNWKGFKGMGHLQIHVLAQNLATGSEDKHEKTQVRESVFGPKFELDKFRSQIWSVTATLTCSVKNT